MKIVFLIFIFMVCFLALDSSVMNLRAQQAIIDIKEDDVLPIAPARFDDAIEPPKDNFSSVNKNDMWERFERGELDEKAFLKLQEEYQALANQSKDPYVKRKIASEKRRLKGIELRKAKIRAAQKAKEERLMKKKEKSKTLDEELGLTDLRVPASASNSSENKNSNQKTKPTTKSLPKKK